MPSRDKYESIVWERLDLPGHEFAGLAGMEGGWRLSGAAVFTHERQPCHLEYDIRCDAGWLTEQTTVSGRVGTQQVDIEILRNPAGEWALNGSKIWELTDCDDIDLNFSPCTNLLPIRRLNLAVGESAPVRAAWLRFSGFSLELFEQTYTRIAADKYVYESAGGKFRRELTVDETGFVIDYPGLWRTEARSSSE